MDDGYVDIPNIQGYVSIKDAANMLGLSTRRVYEYVTDGRLPGVRAVNAIMIPLEEIQKFQRGTAGRDRKVVPLWRSSSGKNTQFMTSIKAQIKAGQESALMKILDEIKRNDSFLFPGTIARYFSNSLTTPGHLEIVLIWRGTIMPDTEIRQQELQALQQALANEVDWNTAQYDEGTILIHT